MSHHPQPAVPRRRLTLLGRYPRPGEAKTRLIPLMGATGAADLHRRLAEKSLAAAMACQHMAGVEFCYDGATPKQMDRWLGPKRLQLTPQRGRGLGDRMRNALFRALDQGCPQAVLVGTDIPAMETRHLQEAFDALCDHDLVLGPSRDGGYWLVGLGRKAEIFKNIEWGTSKVLEQTLAAARGHGLSVRCLSPLQDMDTPVDVKDTLPPPQWEGPYLSVIIPALNEARHIGRVLDGIRHPECELIVADGGSTDGTPEVARMAGATVITSRAGRARQQNAGAAIARGRVLLFLHADTLLPEDYPEQVFHTLLDHRVVAGAFQFKTDYHHKGMRLIEKTVRLRSTLFQLPYGDQALFMPRTIFDRAGGFPLTPIAEDLYLVLRLGRLGRIGLATGAALTSGRRWRRIGIGRTTAVNYLIAIGCMLGIAPEKLAPLYKLGVKKDKGVT